MSTSPVAHRPTSRLRARILVAIAAVVVLAAGAFGAWALLGRSTPAAVGLATQTPGASADATPGASPTPAAASPVPAGSGTPAPGGSAGPLDGTWIVDPTVGTFDDFSGSFVGYRVQEELAGIGATEAVGRTPDVTGSVTVEGGVVTAASFTADLTTLRSDDERRDGQLRRQALETDRFPDATFTLTAPFEIGTIATGETVSGSVLGDLTLHGVTRFVELEFDARLADDIVTLVATTEIVFADYGIEQPRSMIVLSVADRGTMELQLHLSRG